MVSDVAAEVQNVRNHAPFHNKKEKQRKNIQSTTINDNGFSSLSLCRVLLVSVMAPFVCFYV